MSRSVANGSSVMDCASNLIMVMFRFISRPIHSRGTRHLLGPRNPMPWGVGRHPCGLRSRASVLVQLGRNPNANPRHSNDSGPRELQPTLLRLADGTCHVSVYRPPVDT